MVLPNITSAVRLSCPHLLNFGRQWGLHKVHPVRNVIHSQIAFITGKAQRVDRPPRPPPFDYVNKEYGLWALYTDPMEARLDDNSRVVVIDGPPAVGKDKFAKKLADELEMFYMPPPKYDDLFINAYGFDYRSINDQLPVDAQYFDEKMFFADPTNRNSTAMQNGFYTMRYSQYIDALLHVFSTGQGAVVQRCPWSDMVFMKAMHKMKYVSDGGLDYYNSVHQATIHNLLRPHLVIYLDIPTSVVEERIKRRGIPQEANSKALTTKYLDEIISQYKHEYLPTISKHAQILMYNWTQEGDMNEIIDDIEALQFEDFDRENSKMDDWKFSTNEARREWRSIYANDKDQLLFETRLIRFDIPEMIISADDQRRAAKVIDKLAETIPGIKYEEGFDPNVDKGILWKMLTYNSFNYGNLQNKKKSFLKK